MVQVESRRCAGRCIPVQCDHSKDDDVQKLFDRVKAEQDGRLDVLVNNAYSAISVRSAFNIIKYISSSKSDILLHAKRTKINKSNSTAAAVRVNRCKSAGASARNETNCQQLQT